MVINVSIEGIKQLLSQKDNAEIRMGLAQAKDIGINLDDRDLVRLFKEGIAVDIMIRKVGEDDILPERLQEYINGKEKDWLFEGIFKTKIIDIGRCHTLDMMEAIELLINVIPQDYTFGYWSFGIEEKDDFSRIRVINNKRCMYLNLKEVRDLLCKTIPSDRYEFLVEEIT